MGNHLLWHTVEALNFGMEQKMMRGIKERAEAAHRARLSWRLDELLPMETADIRLRHTVTINQPREVVWQALQQVRMVDMPLLRGLMALRTAGTTEPEQPVEPYEELPIFDFLDSIEMTHIVEVPGRELMQLLMGHFWQADGGFQNIPRIETFVQADDPTWVKCALSFQLEDVTGGTDLTAEMRLVTPSEPKTAQTFTWYWRLAGFIGATVSMRGIQSAAKFRAENAPAITVVEA